MASQNLTYVDIDRKQALEYAVGNKADILKGIYGNNYDGDMLSIRHELKFDVSFALLTSIRDSEKWDKFLALYHHPSGTKQDRENCITYMYNHFSRYYNDQSINCDILPEPIQLKRAFDRCVNTGLKRTAQLITGESNIYFTHMYWGEGTAKVLPKDTRLQIPVARTSFNESGYAESRGSEIAFFARFKDNIPEAAVNESGVFDGIQTTSTMLQRVVYGGATMTHFFLDDQVSIMTLIYQLSV